MAMQRLLTLRLLSKNHHINSFISLTKTQKAPDNFVSKYSYTALSGSWVKPHYNVSWFLANPVLVNKFLQKSNALMKAPSKGLLDFKWVFARRYSRQKSSHFSSSFNYFFHFREWLQRSNPYVWVMGLTAANFSIYLVWKIADRGYMIKNFMVSVENLRSGRVHTLITSAFSHMDFVHVISNMAVFMYFGQNIATGFGSEFLLKLYLYGALPGSVFYLVYQAFLIPSKSKQRFGLSPLLVPEFGASGPVYAVMLFSILSNPKRIMLLESIIPVPAILFGIFVIGKDVSYIRKGDSFVSGLSHLGGAAVAVIMWARYRRFFY